MSRFLSYGTSIFTTMSLLAQQWDAVNLAQGFPDFDAPEEIKEAAIKAIRDGNNQYAPSPGLPALRQKLVDYRLLRSNLSYCPKDETTIFSGGTEALFCALIGLSPAGSEVISFAPFYDSYLPAIEAAGASMKQIVLEAPDFRITKEALDAAITKKTKIILFNNPHNPTGRVFDLKEQEIIAEAALKHDLLVITDEVYEEIYFDEARYHYFATLAGMKERTVAISSTSKTFSATGWKVGFAFAPKALTQVLRAVHQFTVFCSATPLQHAMVHAFSLPQSYYHQLRSNYLAARNTLMDILERSGQKVYKPQGSYFILADYKNVSSAHKSDFDFAAWQTEHGKIASIPISSFYLDAKERCERQTLVRYAFCKTPATLERARQAIEKFY